MTRFRQETGMEKANLKRVFVQIVYTDEVIVEIYDYIRGWILSLTSLPWPIQPELIPISLA